MENNDDDDDDEGEVNKLILLQCLCTWTRRNVIKPVETFLTASVRST
jgi:hypothetical protein